MIPRKQLDIGWFDLIAAIGHCLTNSDRRFLESELNSTWTAATRSAAVDETSRDVDSSAMLTALSVRSGFDATLTALNWPTGSDVLVSAVTIRDMPRILVEHGLRVIPVDLDMASLTVNVENLRRAVTPNTRGILVAHLFGARMPMQPIIDVAREHGLFVFEDCAQAFTGEGDIGHPASDVRLFSFGPIKTATALGGAVLTFRDDDLRDRAHAIQTTWPAQSCVDFLRRAIRFAMLKAVSSRSMFTLFANSCRWLGRSHDDLLSKGVRGFAGDDFFARIRRRPAVPLLSLLLRRLKQDHRLRIARRRGLARKLDQILRNTDRPGRSATDHSFWVFPILHAQPDALVRRLWQHGFDATRGASSMGVVESSATEEERPRAASESLDRLLYLPFDSLMTQADLDRLATVLREFPSNPIPN